MDLLPLSEIFMNLSLASFKIYIIKVLYVIRNPNCEMYLIQTDIEPLQ